VPSYGHLRGNFKGVPSMWSLRGDSVLWVSSSASSYGVPSRESPQWGPLKFLLHVFRSTRSLMGSPRVFSLGGVSLKWDLSIGSPSSCPLKGSHEGIHSLESPEWVPINGIPQWCPLKGIALSGPLNGVQSLESPQRGHSTGSTAVVPL
jgi:hypothetical protein